METLRLIAFARPPALVAAIRNGYFADEGLEIAYTQTKGSAPQIRGLLGGEWDLAHTAVDNVLAYVNAEDADLFVFLVADLGINQKVVARPDIGTLEDLRGKTLGLDHLTTGYAFMLYKILALKGIGRDQYETVPVGGTAERGEALVKGEIDAALLSPPFDERALAQGYRVLAATADYFPGYPGLTAATTRAWAKEHHDQLVRYCRALLKGVDWAADPANRSRLISLLAEDLGRSQADAEDFYNRETQARERNVTSVREMREAIERVRALRNEMDTEHAPKAAHYPLERYFDPTYVLEAKPSLGA